MVKKKGDPLDHPTPLTDALIEKMLEGDGIPKGCKQWQRIVKHAREMERRAYCYRAVAAAAMKASDRGEVR